MIELNELDKEYIALCTKDVDEEKKEECTARRIKELELRGNIQKKSVSPEGFPRFTFKDGFTTTIAPRRYKFNGPLIPTPRHPASE